ncbi:F-box protein DOR-like [Papaver somniferum]|uniref:F-box protein DOR-like n=1 Tax=Papaver somniferum TaxID=3469 RepID=UPI000E7016DD|nr:F-box protein DOR-like [Papaver somniferum]
MHLEHHLNHVDSDSDKFSFIALADNEIENNSSKFYYFEYNENHDQSTTQPIERIRRINLNPPFKPFQNVFSCNGLICLDRHPFLGAQPHCICNPITKEYIVLPEIKTGYCDPSWSIEFTSGFGYVSSTNEYKVVGIYRSEPRPMEVYVYTLGSGNGWRNVDSQFSCTIHWDQGAFVNGAIYWMCNELEIILAFDLAEEKFSGHILPPLLPPDSIWQNNRIGVLNGFLFFASYLVVEGAQCFDIWLLKKKDDKHGVKERDQHQSFVWSKEFRVADVELFGVTKSNGVVTYTNNYLNIYDTKASTSKRIVDFKERFLAVIPHKNTLVSLTELGEKDAKIMESVKIEETESHD